MVEWILSSSVLIGIVIVLRWVFRNRLKLRVRYALWGLVLVRLLLPFSIGKAVISVGSWTEAVISQPAVQEIVEIQVNVQSPESAYQEVLEDYRNQGVHVEHLDRNTLDQIWQEAEKQAEKKPLGDILALTAKILWISGAAVVAAFFLFSNFHFGGILWKNRRGTELRKGKLPVYTVKGLDSPCLFGVVKPGIYITEEVSADPTLLRHTLEHEAVHYRHGDHIWAILRGLCLALHWYNPLVWAAAILSQRDGEMACDEATVIRLGEGERAEYGRTLIGITCGKKGNVLLAATRMTNGSLRERILMIARKPKMAGYILAAVVLAAAVAVGITFSGAAQADPQTTDPTEEIWDTKPYITYEGVNYYDIERGVQILPEGYEYIGILSVEDARDLDYAGYQIFGMKDRETMDHFYLYGETGTVVGDTYYHDRKQMAYTLFGTEDYSPLTQTQSAQEDAFFRSYDTNGIFLGKAENYALLYSDGEAPQLRILQYAWEDGTVKVLQERAVEAVLSKGISVNHLQLKTGHLYFGSVDDGEDSWETLELSHRGDKLEVSVRGRKAWFCLLTWPMTDFRVLRTDGSTVFNMGEFLRENTVNEISFQSPESSQPPPQTEATFPPEEPVLAELDDPNMGPLYSQTASSLFSIIVQPTGIARAGDHRFYVIPENQDAFVEAYEEAVKYAYKKETGEPGKAEAYTGLTLTYRKNRWMLMENGALEWFGSRIAPEDTGQLLTLCKEAAAQAGVQAPIRPEELKGIQSATLEWNGTWTVTNPAILAKLEGLLSGSEYLEGGAACPFGSILTLRLKNGQQKVISMGVDDCSTWMSNGVFYEYTDGDLEEELSNTVFYSLFASTLVRNAVLENDNPMRWVRYINWSAYDAAYGSAETRKLMGAMKECFRSNQAYQLAFYCLNGLDAEYTPLYAEMLAQLAEEDKAAFAKQYFDTWQELRARINTLLSGHWNLSPEETDAKLQAFRSES